MQKEAKLLTITQAAQFLKVSPDTLRRWEEKGIITPTRSKGGIRKYTLLDLKIAKLNKRKTKFFHISGLIRQNYINSWHDAKVAFLTCLLWVFGIFIYNLITPIFSLPGNFLDQNISQLNKSSHQTALQIVPEPKKIEIQSMHVSLAPNTAPKEPTAEVSITPETNLFMSTKNSDSLLYSNKAETYFSLKPLPEKNINTDIKRI